MSPKILFDNNIVIQRVDDAVYLSDAITRQIFRLNDTGEFIAERLLQGRAVDAITDDLIREFEIDDRAQVEQDINAFIENFKNLRFIATDDYPRKNRLKLSKVTFGITSKCNLSCKHCFAGSTLGQSHSDFAFEKICSLIKEMEGIGVEGLSLFGGEPMIRSDIFDIVDVLSRTKMHFQMNTNGTLIDANAIARFRDTRLRNFTVSLDGSSPEINDPFRSAESFARSVKGIQGLVRANMRVVISSITNKYNFRDLGAIVRLCKELGVDQVRFVVVSFGGNAACFRSDIAMSADEYHYALNDMLALQEQYGIDFVTGEMLQSQDLVAKCKRGESMRTLPLRVDPCQAALKKCCIRADGYVTPCEVIWDATGWNVNERALADIWDNDPVMLAFRRPYMLGKESLADDCHHCEYLRFCYEGHRCYFTNFAKSDKPSRLISCLKSD